MASRFCDGLSVSAMPEQILLFVQAHSMYSPLREELGEQFVDNWEKCKWPVFRAVPRVTAFGEVHYNALNAMRRARFGLQGQHRTGASALELSCHQST